MARELARESNPTTTDGGSAVGRRSWLRLCATVVGAVLALVGVGSGTGPEPTRRLTVTGTTPTATNYEITVSDVIVPAGGATAHVDAGPSVEDAIGDGAHVYRFDGELTNLVAGADTLVYVDGQRVTAA